MDNIYILYVYVCVCIYIRDVTDKLMAVVDIYLMLY